MLPFLDYLPPTKNTYALLNSSSVIMTLMCTMELYYFSSQRFFRKHTNSSLVGASDIGQEFAYTCKLQELPTGTSQRSSSLCTSKGSTQITRYLFLRNNIQICFLLRKLLRKIPYKYREFLSSEISKHIQLMVSSQKPSQNNISLAVSEGSSHGTTPKLPPIF